MSKEPAPFEILQALVDEGLEGRDLLERVIEWVWLPYFYDFLGKEDEKTALYHACAHLVFPAQSKADR